MISADQRQVQDLLQDFIAVAARYPLLAVLYGFLFVAINIEFAGVSNWHDGQRLLQIAALIPAVLLCVWGGVTADFSVTWRHCPAWMRVALLIALLLGLWSAVTAALPRWALLEWSMTLCLGLLVMGVAAASRFDDAQRDGVLIGWIYVVALAYSLKSVLAYLLMFLVGADYQLAFSVEELFPGFSNVRFFGHIQTMLLPFLVLPALLWGRGLRQRALLLAVPAFWWMLAIASGTRGSWVALLIGAITALFLGGASGKRWLHFQVTAFLFGGLCYLIFVLGLPELIGKPTLFLHRTHDFLNLNGREVIWSLSWQLIKLHPWLGIGPMHFAQQLSLIASHPHNAVLQWMVEWGATAGLMMTTVMAAAGLKFSLRVWRYCYVEDTSNKQLKIVALLAALAGVAAQAMVDGVLVMPVSQMLFVLLCGWALGWSLAVQPVRRASYYGVVARILILLPLIILLRAALPEVMVLEQRLEEHLKVYPIGPHQRLLPRFWIQGWIP